MGQMTKVEFAQCMARLTAAYREKVEQATVEVYYEALGQYDAEDLGVAIREVIEDIPRFPSVADIRARAVRVRRERQSSRPRLQPAPETELPVAELMADLKQRMGWV